MTSVQAALNVIISVLGTIGIWSFSRYWWQRGCAKIMRDDSDVPLPTLYTIANSGESWEVVTVLRRRLLHKENWRLLLQVTVVVLATLACVLSGPIAKASLRETRVAHTSKLEILRATKGGGSSSNLLEDNVLWNETIKSLDDAQFPTNQLLDYLPPSTVPWNYVASEWDPTWTMQCNYTPETILHNVTSSGEYTFYDPINAFPEYRDTYDSAWLNASQYRMQADFESWTIETGRPDAPFSDVLFFVLIESDPEIDDRMHTNNATMQMSMSVLHARNFRVANYDNPGEAAAATWRPLGPVENASFSRVECTISRKSEFADENSIPWPWTNDTYSITMGYRTYLQAYFDANAPKGLPVLTPSPHDIIRFYQAYFITTDTTHSYPSLGQVSVWKDTVQLSVIFLSIVVILTALTSWQTGRYFLFLHRHRAKLGSAYVPDGKLEWMIHTAKACANSEDEVMVEGIQAKDRDYFRSALFGFGVSKLDSSNFPVKAPGLARVYTNRTSISGATTSRSGSVARVTSLTREGDKPVALIVVNEGNDEGSGHQLKQTPSSVDSQSTLTVASGSVDERSRPCSCDHSLYPDDELLKPQISRSSSSKNKRRSFSRSTRQLIDHQTEKSSDIEKSGGTLVNTDDVHEQK